MGLLDQDRVGAHFYDDPMMDTNWYGPRNSKDTSLMIPNKEVHVVRTSQDQNLDFDSWKRGLQTIFEHPMQREYETVSSNRGSDEGKNIILDFDPLKDRNAFSLTDFEPGGYKKTKKEPESYVAPNVVPKTGPENHSLNRNMALNQTHDVGNGKKLSKDSRENFMKSREAKGIKSA